MTTQQLENKIAVITGATQGLGAATAGLFAERGAAGLVLCGRNRERGESVASAIRDSGCPACFVAADVSNVTDCHTVIATADKEFGRVDALVNCAAMTDRGTILDTSPELFDQLFHVNTRGPFFLMQYAAKLMIREAVAGAMVNILSTASHGGQPFICAYSGSKGALAVLTKNAAYSLLRNRIRVNGLNIGWMDTPGEDHTQKTYHQAEATWLERAESRQPFGRLLKPVEVAKAIAFLSSDESGMMTGSLVDFDQSVPGCFDTPPHPVAALGV